MRIVQFDDHLRLPGAALAFVCFGEADGADEVWPAPWLGAGERAYAARLRVARRRAAWLAGRLASKMALSSLLPSPPPLAQIEILPAPGGEPVVCGAAREAGLDVSIAHTQAMAAALAFERARTGAMGIDIETCDQPLDPALVDFAFSDEEAEALASLGGAEDRHRRALQLWTAKEAALKAVRRGLRLPLSAVHVTCRDDEGPGRASVQCTPETRVPFEVRAVGCPGHVVAVAVEATHAR